MNWINAKEEKPNTPRIVLGWVAPDHIDDGEFDHVGFSNGEWTFSNGQVCEVTHWMDISAPEVEPNKEDQNGMRRFLAVYTHNTGNGNSEFTIKKKDSLFTINEVRDLELCITKKSIDEKTNISGVVIINLIELGV